MNCLKTLIRVWDSPNSWIKRIAESGRWETQIGAVMSECSVGMITLFYGVVNTLLLTVFRPVCKLHGNLSLCSFPDLVVHVFNHSWIQSPTPWATVLPMILSLTGFGRKYHVCSGSQWSVENIIDIIEQRVSNSYTLDSFVQLNFRF